MATVNALLFSYTSMDFNLCLILIYKLNAMWNSVSNTIRLISKLPSAAKVSRRLFIIFTIKTKYCLSFTQVSSGSSALIKSVKLNVINSIKLIRI